MTIPLMSTKGLVLEMNIIWSEEGPWYNDGTALDSAGTLESL